MTAKAPDLYAVNSAQLAEEMNHIEVADSMKWCGAFAIVTGVRRDPITGLTHPVLIIKSGGRNPMHLIALPGSD